MTRTKKALTHLICVAAVIAALVAAFPVSAAAADVVGGNTYGNVAAVQARLTVLGYYGGGVDGKWGSRTLSAVKKFQSDNGLKADGAVGSATAKKLNVSLNVTGSITLGKSDFNVGAVQARLKTFGYYRSRVDGLWGKTTLNALLRYQASSGLKVDGIVGGGTAKKLGITLYGGDRTGGISAGKTTANIKSLQTALKSSGYYTGVVDGKWGRNTLCALLAFQSDSGLTVDGVAGNATLKKLGITLGSGSGGSSGSSGGGTAGGNVSDSDLDLLARCVYGESRGEPYTGQVAVAAVVLNRVRSSKFPNTISGVIYQSGAFTAVSDGQINLTPNQSAYNAARDALNGWDPTGGCLYYYNPATATSSWIWSLTVHIKIGKHNFAL